MPLADPLPIRPFARPAKGGVKLPGSKSITNRALLLGALGDGPVTLTGALFSQDTEIMSEALRRLGFSVERDPGADAIRVAGRGGKIPSEKAELFVGNAGTAARFLTALCAAAPRGTFRLDGVPAMRKRPMKGLIEALRSQGAEIRCLGEEGCLPIELAAHGLRGGEVRIDAGESSQMLSALLMVAPLARAAATIRLAGEVREPFVRMTLAMMAQFGAEASGSAPPDAPLSELRVSPGPYALRARTAPRSYAVEPDATAAGYFLALPLAANGYVGFSPALIGSPLQGDVRFLDVLERAGLSVVRNPRDAESRGLPFPAIGRDPPRTPAPSGPPGSRTGAPPFLPGGLREDFAAFSDTFLTLAALAPLLPGRTAISGIGHTRRQETDRVAGAAAELRKLGQEVVEREDALEIDPRPLPLRGDPVEIETYGDHRFAMSFAILGCRDARGDGRPWLAIRDPGCCAKTFPGFFEELESLRAASAKS